VQVDKELASGEFFLQETEKKRRKLQEVKVRSCSHFLSSCSHFLPRPLPVWLRVR